MEEGRCWLSTKVLRQALREDEKRQNREVLQDPICDGGEQEICEGVRVEVNTKYDETGWMT